jgi:cardiolipin synthase
VKLKQIPNLICILRILLVAPIIWSLLENDYGLALLLILTAGLSDALDGYLARRFDWRTRLGGLLDPAADKLLMFSLFLTLSWLGWVPIWFTAVVIGRDVVIVAGIIAYQALVEPVHGNPTLASKLNTVLQIALALLVIAHAWRGWPPMAWLELLGAAVLVTIATSVIQYIAEGVSALKKVKQSEG